MKKNITIGTVLLAALCMASFAGAANITIDHAGGGDYTTIQAGITAAVDGADTVWITDGTYTGAGNVNLDFGGKAITVRSVSDDPATCIIDCENTSETRGFYFHNSETSTSVVRGLTVQNGNMNGSSPNNRGGGIYCHSASPTITNCTISGNSADYGSGINCHSSSSPTITNCTFSGNAADYGGGIYCYFSSSPTITNCTISGNAADYGGGIDCYSSSSPTITNCTISGNSATGYGGGIYCYDYCSPTITNCTISGNSATDYGGGIYCYNSSSPTITNCTISGNSADYGGGIYCQNFSSSPITNCTISGNSATSYGGGICCYGSSSPPITNCILWGDSAATGNEIHVNSGSPTADYCDIEGGCPAGVTCTNCMDQDPLFVGGSPFDYHLASGSPCINAGTGAGAPGDDIDGDARPLGLGFDMGSDEYEVSIACGDFLNNADTTGGSDNLNAGSCGYAGADVLYAFDTSTLSSGDTITATLSDEEYVDFYVSILNGCDPATDCLDSNTTTAQTVWNGSDEICIAVDGGEGTFDLNVSCCAPAGAIYIGAVSYCTIQEAIDAASPSDTVWLADRTYKGFGDVNLDFGGKAITVRSVSDDPTTCIIDCQNASHTRGFHFHTSETSSSIVRGLTVRNGNADWSYPYGYGGGICCDSSSPTITNCTISGNTAVHGGGGAIYCYSSDPTIANCTISGNSAYYGGGICCKSSSPTITNCTISGNSVTNDAGGIHCRTSSSPTITNCTISGNSAADYGGGIYCNNSSSPSIKNCILWGNSAATGNEIHVDSGSPKADYCDIEGGCPADVTCTNCMDVDPLFVGGSPFDYHLASGSPCIDAGTDSGAPGDDIDGDPRPIWCFYDMGSDEYSKTMFSCGDSLNDADTTGLADMLNTGSCGYAGADVLYKLDTSTLSSGATITATLSDEEHVDFYISILNGCDPAADCLDSDTTTAQTVWNGTDEIYIAVDGGEGMFDLDVTCVSPTATPTNTPTETPVPYTATDTPGGPTPTAPPIPSSGGTGVMLMVLLMTLSLVAILGRRVKN